MELLVMIKIDGQRCALRALQVHSVIEIEAITAVPHAPDHILGLCTKRSQTLTVIDCLRAAGKSKQVNPLGKRAAVVEHEGHVYALLVDEVEDVEDSTNEIVAVEGGYGTEWSYLAEGMVETAQGPALLLNIDRLIAGAGGIQKAA